MIPALAAISHGTSSPDGQLAVAALVAAVAAARPRLTTRAGFVDVQHPDVAETLAALAPVEPVVIVPLLLSAGYHVHVDLAREIASAGRRAVLADALGPDRRLVACLIDRLDALGLHPSDRIVLACAGSSDAAAVNDCHETARMLAEALGRPVRAGFISAVGPSLADAVAAERAVASRSRVVVSTYLLAPGHFADIAAATAADAATAPLLLPGEAPLQGLIELVLERFAEASKVLERGLVTV